jgi:hypothetical protein
MYDVTSYHNTIDNISSTSYMVPVINLWGRKEREQTLPCFSFKCWCMENRDTCFLILFSSEIVPAVGRQPHFGCKVHVHHCTSQKYCPSLWALGMTYMEWVKPDAPKSLIQLQGHHETSEWTISKYIYMFLRLETQGGTLISTVMVGGRSSTLPA